MSQAVGYYKCLSSHHDSGQCILQACGQSLASAAHTMRRFARRDPTNVSSTSLAELVHPPLTLPKHPQAETDTHQFKPEPAEALPFHDTLLQHTKQLGSQQRELQPIGPADTLQPVTAQSEQVPAEQVPAELAGGKLPSRPQVVGGQLPETNLLRSPVKGVFAASTTHPVQTASDLPATSPDSGPQQLPCQPSHHDTSSVVVADERHDATGADGTDSSSGLQAILASPAALQALLKDPARLQRLLEKNPALISVLKSRLSSKS